VREDIEIKGQIAELRADVADLKDQLEVVMQNQDAQTQATAALVEAWNTGTGVVKFVKWLAGLVGAVGVILAASHADFGALAKTFTKP
jgi:roadblock/LC7 domain-containing protein